jgi:hypothetical protein
MRLELIENNIKKVTENLDKTNFIFNFLLSYDLPKASINRLKKGDYNKSKNINELIWKKKILYRVIKNEEDIHYVIDELSKSDVVLKNSIKFIIVTDFVDLLSIDIKNKETLDIKIDELSNYANFFLPLVGIEKFIIDKENPADIKAAQKIAKLYDKILSDNQNFYDDEEKKKELNVFFTKLLFCYFAEDTDIFGQSQFTNSIVSNTKEDGDDLNNFLSRLFESLNIKDKKNYPNYIKEFPYVNGNLFSNNIIVPNFSKESRKLIIENGKLDWASINPDIFGSMMQAIISQDERKDLGIHYTSVSNILKLIKPLFLDELYDKFLIAENNEDKLEKVLRDIYNLKIFDPACGSGNFLIISYKELAKLEIQIFKKLQKLDKLKWSLAISGIKLNNFYGIEINNQACEITKLSLWLSEHQMNKFFEEVFGKSNPTLPLKSLDNIINENATRINWEKICKPEKKEKVVLLGNPPYLGGKKLNYDQKEDMIAAGLSKMLQLDYIGCWFIKASDYIANNNSRFAFVSTSSICQGEQVHLLWKYIFSKNLEIYFAYEPFKWSNSARGQAGVFCNIVGVSNINYKKEKYLFFSEEVRKVKNISPYLFEGESIFIEPRNEPLSNLPPMQMGSNPVDGKNLIVTKDQFKKINIKREYSNYFKKFVSGNDFTRGDHRYCIWIPDNEVDHAMKHEFILDRVNKCRNYRKNSTSRDAKKSAKFPYKFCYSTYREKQAIIVPKTSTSSRYYLPIGYINKDTVAADGSLVIYDPEPYIFSILSTRLHTLWLSTVGGRHASGFRYSVKLVYNSLPLPKITNEQKKILEKFTFDILEEREKYTGNTIDSLYNIQTMPIGLDKIHKSLDTFFESLYGSSKMINDNDKLKILFNNYSNLLNERKLI